MLIILACGISENGLSVELFAADAQATAEVYQWNDRKDLGELKLFQKHVAAAASHKEMTFHNNNGF